MCHEYKWTTTLQNTFKFYYLTFISKDQYTADSQVALFKIFYSIQEGTFIVTFIVTLQFTLEVLNVLQSINLCVTRRISDPVQSAVIQ